MAKTNFKHSSKSNLQCLGFHLFQILQIIFSDDIIENNTYKFNGIKTNFRRLLLFNLPYFLTQICYNDVKKKINR